MSGQSVRKGFLARFSQLNAYPRRVAIAVVASYVLQIAAAIWLGDSLLDAPPDLPEAIVLGLLMIFIGTRLRGLNNIVHECSHFSFAEKRADNVTIGRICASLILGSFADYRAEHMTHHAHVGDYERDLDLRGIREYRLEEALTWRSVLRHALTPVAGLHLRRYVRPNLSAADGPAFLALKIILIAGATFALALDPVSALLLVWIPYIWIFTAINYWTDCADHAGLIGAPDDLDSSRNVAMTRPLRLLLFPRNDCFHLVHHLFPQVPARYLGACHRELLSHPDYRARSDGIRATAARL